jgi:hypothetical protein
VACMNDKTPGTRFYSNDFLIRKLVSGMMSDRIAHTTVESV